MSSSGRACTPFSPTFFFVSLAPIPLGFRVPGECGHTPAKQGEPLTEARVLQALCNAVISASVEKDEDNKVALKLLAELLAQDAVDPNAGDEAMWDIVRATQADRRKGSPSSPGSFA